MSNFRVSYNNFGASNPVVYTASSALVSFPASYAFDVSRSKKWKPSGSFRIDSTNNKIYINDGADKTVTLTSAVYATGTLLAAHIQTQLNASSSNWTATYSSSTGLFTLGRSSGTKVLRLSVTTSAVWDTIGFIGTTNQDASVADVRRNHTSERMSFDFGIPREVTFFSVYQSVDSQFSISTAATCTLKANNIDDLASAPYSKTLTVTNEGIFHFVPDDEQDFYRYWWFDFEDRENSEGPESFSLKIWIGDYVEPVTRNFVNGFSITKVDPSIVSVSTNGVKYFNRKSKYKRISNVGIEWVTGEDRVSINDWYDYTGISRPFFISIDPKILISSGLQEFTKLVTFDADPDMNHLRYNYYGFNFSFSEVVG